ncbi:hypothetical protein AVEN_162167-1 [Araneus ventricosus]|uniref:LRRCT domain-containing protein n=1 Tax=Araneus ventricosus TaxID=182803 RepID=A0A4Y2GZ38_ARAVE|nr:hypothetical protein AVEN_162167-1 [Araneus ventricosus]
MEFPRFPQQKSLFLISSGKFTTVIFRHTSGARAPQLRLKPRDIPKQASLLQEHIGGKLHTIEVNALSELDSLVWLYLPSNQLSVAPYETFRSVLDTLQILDLHENPFNCDCRIAWFRDLVRDQKSRVVNMPRETRCEAPPLLKGKAIAYVTGQDLGCVVEDSCHPFLPCPSLLLLLLLTLLCT